MTQRILVVSDLHLGGSPGGDGKPSFQICPPEGQQRLAEFFDWAAAQAKAEPQRELHLVLNGDIVDFLAEPDGEGRFSALTLDQDLASAKLAAVFESTKQVWDALQRYVETGASLVLLLGNHDVELTLPQVRRKLLDRLGRGRVEFLYDNEALNFGPVLIEHGNRYDAWNAVFHNQLRELRSALSRRLPQAELPEVPVQPGSNLVVKVMNDIKQKFPFVDLLKPERGGVMPLLAFLDPTLWLQARKGVRDALRTSLDRRKKTGDPSNRDQVSGYDEDDHDALFEQAAIAASGGTPDEISGDDSGARPSFRERWQKAATDALKSVQLKALHRALRSLVDTHRITFDVEHEDEEYLAPARARLDAGFELVVLGHTHLAKDVDLTDPKMGGSKRRYLNTGTWVDLMRVPDAVFSNEANAPEALREFADALATNQLGPWRKRAPTYADIRLTGEHIESAGVFFFDSSNQQVPLSTEGLRRRVSS